MVQRTSWWNTNFGRGSSAENDVGNISRSSSDDNHKKVISRYILGGDVKTTNMHTRDDLRLHCRKTRIMTPDDFLFRNFSKRIIFDSDSDSDSDHVSPDIYVLYCSKI